MENDIFMAMHKDLCDEIHELCVRKNKDYGNSVHDSYEEFGIISYLVRMTDKMNRLKKLCLSNEQLVKDESIEDTFIDLANYCLLAIVDLRNDRTVK